jgi:hypothetical protein
MKYLYRLLLKLNEIVKPMMHHIRSKRVIKSLKINSSGNLPSPIYGF